MTARSATDEIRNAVHRMVTSAGGRMVKRQQGHAAGCARLAEMIRAWDRKRSDN